VIISAPLCYDRLLGICFSPELPAVCLTCRYLSIVILVLRVRNYQVCNSIMKLSLTLSYVIPQLHLYRSRDEYYFFAIICRIILSAGWCKKTLSVPSYIKSICVTPDSTAGENKYKQTSWGRTDGRTNRRTAKRNEVSHEGCNNDSPTTHCTM